MKKRIFFILLVVIAVSLGNPLSGSSQEVVKIGGLHPLTGPASYFGLPQQRGADLAAEVVNQRGGIKIGGKGYKIEFIHYDTKGLPDEGVAAVQRLIARDKVKFMVGTLASRVASAYEPIIRDKDVISIVVGAQVVGITENPNIYRPWGQSPDHDSGVARFVKGRGLKRVAIFTDSTHSGFMQNNDAFFKQLEDGGAKIVAKEFFKLGDTDFFSQLTKIKGVNSDGIIVRGYPAESVSVTKQGKELGIANVVYVWDTVAKEETVLKLVDSKTMEGVMNSTMPVLLEYVAIGDKKAIAVNEMYQQKYKEPPGDITASAWDGTHILAKAIEQAGTATDLKQVRTALDNIRLSDVPDAIQHYELFPGGKIFKDRQAQINATVKEWKSGRWVVTKW